MREVNFEALEDGNHGSGGREYIKMVNPLTIRESPMRGGGKELKVEATRMPTISPEPVGRKGRV